MIAALHGGDAPKRFDRIKPIDESAGALSPRLNRKAAHP